MTVTSRSVPSISPCTARRFGRWGCLRGVRGGIGAIRFSRPRKPLFKPDTPGHKQCFQWVGRILNPTQKGLVSGFDSGEKSFVFNVVSGVSGSEAGFRAPEKSDAAFGLG